MALLVERIEVGSNDHRAECHLRVPTLSLATKANLKS
jgi:hypothetical protein